MRRASVVAALLLAGCSAGAMREPANAPSRVPEAVVVSTNEPFFSATVERGVVRVSGVDVAPRDVPVVEAEAGPDWRRWRARDGAGEVAVEVRDLPCSDDMSGAAFPLSGTLRLNGQTARGCAYPVGAPRPRPE